MIRNEIVSIPHQVALKVTGMTCGSCAWTIERVLSRVPGVQSAKVDLELGIGLITGTARSADLIAAVAEAGFDASTITIKADETRRP